MFFVSEEFLRKFEAGEDFASSLDEALQPGEGLFDNYESKAEHKRRDRSEGEGE